MYFTTLLGSVEEYPRGRLILTAGASSPGHVADCDNGERFRYPIVAVETHEIMGLVDNSLYNSRPRMRVDAEKVFADEGVVFFQACFTSFDSGCGQSCQPAPARPAAAC
jgi:hypothetical protein